jgi:hypothetical protein
MSMGVWWWSGWRKVAVLVVLGVLGCGGGTGVADGGALGSGMTGEGGSGSGGGSGGDGDPGAPTDAGPVAPAMLTVDAVQNAIVLDRCTGLTPATFGDVGAGQHAIALGASTLSKGSVSSPDGSLRAFDDYVIVQLPLAAGEPASRRFFMLNGIGAMADFTLSAAGPVRLMFIDSDTANNSGQATVTLDGATATVDAIANVLAWNASCPSSPATLSVSERPYRATLVDSTLSTGGGSEDDFVLLRLPSERPMDPSRFVILNSVGASVEFTPYLAESVRAWFISSAPGATGRAIVEVKGL